MNRKIVGLLAIMILCLAIGAKAQMVYTRTGMTHFYSKATLEDIEAVNKKVQCAFNPGSGQVSVKIPIADFVFDKKLMQEHFNENYLESEKYPNAGLEGKIMEVLNLEKDGVNMVTMKGILDLHGVKKEYTIPTEVMVKNGVATNAKAKFKVKLVDHEIKIPTLVIAKIAEEIAIDADFDFLPIAKK